MHKIVLSLFIFLVSNYIFASEPNTNILKVNALDKFIVIKASEKNMFTKISPPQNLLRKMPVTATFNVIYNGFSAPAQTAFQYAIDIWSTLISSSTPIKVIAKWTPLEGDILGSASTSTFYRDFNNAPQTSTWYPTALAEKLYGSQLNHADSADIKANFNSNFNKWYFGIDGNAPAGQYDFVTVVMHELCHGLGFQGSMDISDGQGSWGLETNYPFAFDRFTENSSGQSLLNTVLFPNPSSSLAAQLTSNNIYFNATNANNANGGTPVKLFTPATWDPGSSYSHLDESSYIAGSPNSMMTPSLGAAEAIHHPGNISLSILKDIGWTVQLAGNYTNVYPGDTDNNGVVNALDILPVGVYFLTSDYTRDEISFSWAAKNAIIWSVPEATYADANGDGLVDEKDVIAIGINWGSTHNTSIESFELNPRDKTMLNIYKDNFTFLYNSLSGDNEAVKKMRILLESVLGIEKSLPTEFMVKQNYPNPFNPETNIHFALPQDQKITLKIYNILGSLIATPIDGRFYKAGSYNYKLNAATFPSGVYTYTISTEKYSKAFKMIVLK